MRYGIIKDNKIVNVAVADTYLAINWVQLQDGFGIGDNYVNGIFSKDKSAITVQIPQVLTPRQIRMQLTKEGYRQRVETEIANSTDYNLKDWWEYSLEYKRDNEQLLAMSLLLNISDSELDRMFIEASQL